MKNKKGFTLIELLVVIAVIGILATIVLLNLGGVQDRAKDSRIQSSLSQTRAVAKMAATPLDNYDGVCDEITDASVYKDITAMGGTSMNCFDDSAGFCVEATLNNGTPLCTSGDEVLEGSCGGNHECTGDPLE